MQLTSTLRVSAHASSRKWSIDPFGMFIVKSLIGFLDSFETETRLFIKIKNESNVQNTYDETKMEFKLANKGYSTG